MKKENVPDFYHKIADLYLGGMSAPKAAAVFGMDRFVGYRALEALGIPRRDNSHAAKKHTITENFFESIDTPEKAYWLGFITADGNVCGNLFQIDLKISDKDHLAKMKESFGSSHPIRDRFNKSKSVWQSRFAFSNRTFITHLKAAGIEERKSQTAKVWDGPPHLMSHYWRGVIDGDGSIYCDSGKKWNISLNGSRSMCESFVNFVKKVSKSKACVTNGHGAVFSVCFSGINLVQDIVRALYPEGVLALDRKATLCKELMSQTPKIKRRG